MHQNPRLSRRWPGFIAAVGVALGCALGSTCVASGVRPSDAEAQALAQLRGRIAGQIVWESNRDGSWQLYTMNADGSGARTLTTGPGDKTAACLSADGSRLLYTLKRGGSDQSVWVMGSDGSDATKLIDDASEGAWRRGGQAIEFLRQPDPRKQEWQTWEYDVRTGDERLLFPPPNVQYEPEIWSAIGNDDGTRFVAWSPRPRGTWVLSADGKVQTHVHGGCQGQVSPDQRYGFGVKSPGQFIRFDLSDGGDPVVFNELSGPWDHSYFPCVSRDGKWLLYGACPPDQHDHETSDYELFIVLLRDWQTAGPPVRLTFNTRTDRWPTLHVAAKNPLRDTAPDVAGNRLTNPPPPPLSIFSFAGKDAGPDFGGNWGTWPEEGGCKIAAQYVDGDDAEGGDGGSMRLRYTIDGEPNAVALWMTPQGDTLDLSAYDRLVVYARGDVPSFTVVVKDRNDDGSEVKGSADYFVKGVTAAWQRFELPFDRFQPREEGAKVDWRSVKLMSIALIDGYDEKAGTLQVDNIGAVAGE